MLYFYLEIATIGFRYEDRMECASNYNLWNARVTLVMLENGLWEFANTIVTPPTDPKDLDAHNLKDVKAKKIILEVVKGHLIPHKKKSTKAM